MLTLKIHWHRYFKLTHHFFILMKLPLFISKMFQFIINVSFHHVIMDVAQIIKQKVVLQCAKFEWHTTVAPALFNKDMGVDFHFSWGWSTGGWQTRPSRAVGVRSHRCPLSQHVVHHAMRKKRQKHLWVTCDLHMRSVSAEGCGPGQLGGGGALSGCSLT